MTTFPGRICSYSRITNTAHGFKRLENDEGFLQLVCLSVCLSHLSVRPSVRPFVHSSVSLSVHSSVHPSVSVHPYVRPSVLLVVQSFIFRLYYSNFLSQSCQKVQGCVKLSSVFSLFSLKENYIGKVIPKLFSANSHQSSA